MPAQSRAQQLGAGLCEAGTLRSSCLTACTSSGVALRNSSFSTLGSCFQPGARCGLACQRVVYKCAKLCKQQVGTGMGAAQQLARFSAAERWLNCAPSRRHAAGGVVWSALQWQKPDRSQACRGIQGARARGGCGG